MQVIAPTSPVVSGGRQKTAVLPPEGAAHKTPEVTPTKAKTSAPSSVGSDQMTLSDGESIEVCPECQKVFKRKVDKLDLKKKCCYSRQNILFQLKKFF